MTDGEVGGGVLERREGTLILRDPLVVFGRRAGDPAQVHVVDQVGGLCACCHRVFASSLDERGISLLATARDVIDGADDFFGEALSSKLVQRPLGVFYHVV